MDPQIRNENEAVISVDAFLNCISQIRRKPDMKARCARHGEHLALIVLALEFGLAFYFQIRFGCKHSDSFFSYRMNLFRKELVHPIDVEKGLYITLKHVERYESAGLKRNPHPGL